MERKTNTIGSCAGLGILLILLLPFVSFSQENPDPIKRQLEEAKKKKNNSQKNDNTVTLGLEFSPIIPTSLFNSASNFKTNQTEKIKFGIAPAFSYRFGASIRFDIFKLKKAKLSNQFAFYTGIFYNQRKFNFTVDDVSDPTRDSSLVSSQFKFTSYEVPLIIQLQLRAGEKIWMNVGTGLGIEFCPSQVFIPNNPEQNKGQAGYYFVYVARKSLFIPTFKASFGAEYRTQKSGYFHIGATYSLPLPRLADAFSEYWRNDSQGNPYAVFPNGSKSDPNSAMPISGMYLSLDLKYFFPASKKPKQEEGPLYKPRKKKSQSGYLHEGQFYY